MKVTVTVTNRDYMADPRRAILRAIGRACRDIGVYWRNYSRGIVIVHGTPIALPLDARTLAARFDRGQFSLTVPDDFPANYDRAFDDVIYTDGEPRGD